MRTDWTRALHNAGVNQSCTRIEIKPHTRTGVNEGVGQLLGSRWSRIPNRACAPGQPLRLFLMTYQAHSPATTGFTIRMLNVDGTIPPLLARRGWLLSSLPFREVGDLDVPDVNTAITKRDCATMLGGVLEDAIRTKYEAQMRLRFRTGLTLAPKLTSATGPDIDHEFAEFLAELATELAAPQSGLRRAVDAAGVPVG